MRITAGVTTTMTTSDPATATMHVMKEKTDWPT